MFTFLAMAFVCGDFALAAPALRPGSVLPLPSGERLPEPVAKTIHWERFENEVSAPSPRCLHGAAAIGDDALAVWGGLTPFGQPLGDGAIYQFDKKKWIPLTAGGPSPRFNPNLYWTGKTLLVWGGSGSVDGTHPLIDGAEYDPSTHRWTPLPPAPLTSPQVWDEVFWTGDYGPTSLQRRLVVLPGCNLSTHARDPHLFPGAVYIADKHRWETLPYQYADLKNDFCRNDWLWAGGSALRVRWGTVEVFHPDTGDFEIIAMQPVRSSAPDHNFFYGWTGEKIVRWGGVGIPYPSSTALLPDVDLTRGFWMRPSDGASGGFTDDLLDSQASAAAAEDRLWSTAFTAGDKVVLIGIIGDYGQAHRLSVRVVNPETAAYTTYFHDGDSPSISGGGPRVDHGYSLTKVGDGIALWGGIGSGGGVSEDGDYVYIKRPARNFLLQGVHQRLVKEAICYPPLFTAGSRHPFPERKTKIHGLLLLQSFLQLLLLIAQLFLSRP